MKYRVYQPTAAPPEPTVWFKLTQGGGVDRVILEAVDENGEAVDRGVLLILAPGEPMILPSSVNPTLGLNLTKSGRLAISNT